MDELLHDKEAIEDFLQEVIAVSDITDLDELLFLLDKELMMYNNRIF